MQHFEAFACRHDEDHDYDADHEHHGNHGDHDGHEHHEHDHEDCTSARLSWQWLIRVPGAYITMTTHTRCVDNEYRDDVDHVYQAHWREVYVYIVVGWGPLPLPADLEFGGLI